MKGIIFGLCMLTAFLLLFGCTTEEGSKCDFKGYVTMNEKTSVCLDGKWTSTCTAGQKYESSSDTFLCTEGTWVKQK